MSEPEDGDFTLRISDDEEVECTRDNTSLFTFAGNLACYNHIFIVQRQEPDRHIGMYVFQHNPGFLALQNLLRKHNFPAHINLRQIAACDQLAFDNSTFKDLNEAESYPEGWDA